MVVQLIKAFLFGSDVSSLSIWRLFIHFTNQFKHIWTGTGMKHSNSSEHTVYCCTCTHTRSTYV